MSDPAALDAIVAFRAGEDRKSIKTLGLTDAEFELVKSTPKVHGEVKILLKIRQAVAAAKTDSRLPALLELVRKLIDDTVNPAKPAKVVLFATLPATADRLYEFLRGRLGSVVERHRSPTTRISNDAGRTSRRSPKKEEEMPEPHGQWLRFLSDPNCRVLVCDRRAEDGLNLQGTRMILLHYDLPFAPNRLEQRMGRLDRYGVGQPVRSFSLAAPQTNWFRAWSECLDMGFGVFETSIASLQYLVDEEMKTIRTDLLMEGLTALPSATARLGGDGGTVRQELRRIQILDELDAIEVGEEQDKHFAERLKLTELRQKEDWKEATHKWIVEQLRFGDWGATGPTDAVRRYYFQRPKQGHQTLMPVSRLERNFTGVIDRLAPDWMRPSIYPLTYDRHTAQRRKVLIEVFPDKGPKQTIPLPVAVAWIGDAFIDALADYIRWDDRGVCFALWKYRPKMALGSAPALAFRFDFLVEADLGPASGILKKKPHLTIESIRRQTDQLFPPIIQTIWLDDSLKPITDRQTLALFAEPYDKGQGGPQGRDFNLNHERWTAISKTYPAAKWKTLCEKARKAAESALRDQLHLKELTKEKADQADRLAAIRLAQQESRAAHLAPAQRKEEKAQLKLDAAIAEAIVAGIRKPAIRLDSIGVVFVSKNDPFGER